MQGAKCSPASRNWKAVPMKSTANSCPLSFWVMLALSIGMGVSCRKVHSVCATDAHFIAPTPTVERLWLFSQNDIGQLPRFLMHVPLPKAVPLVPYAALGCAQYREPLRNAPRAKCMPCPFTNCDRFFMHVSMRSHIAGHFLRGHRWADQEGADQGTFCMWCGNTYGKCSTSVHGKKIDSNCSLAYHRLRLNSAATPTAMNPSTNLPVRCKVLDCRKWHCTYAMPHHMAQVHPGVSHDYAGCSKEEKTKVLQAVDNFPAPLPLEVKPAAPPALPTVLLALLSGPNQGSSSSGSSSSGSSTTNASSSTSASSSSSAPSGSSDYVPSESMSDLPAACRVTRSQAALPKKRARPKSSDKRACDEWEDDSDA